jgi:hypothetical protein
LCSNPFWSIFLKVLQINHQTPPCERHFAQWSVKWDFKILMILNFL